MGLHFLWRSHGCRGDFRSQYGPIRFVEYRQALKMTDWSGDVDVLDVKLWLGFRDKDPERSSNSER